MELWFLKGLRSARLGGSTASRYVTRALADALLTGGRMRLEAIAEVPGTTDGLASDLRGALAPLLKAGLRWASVDVMDGHFVPNLSFGPDVVRALRKGPPLLDAHLMVEKPDRLGRVFAEAGADWVVFHLEACRRPRALLRRLRALGVGVGLAVKPKTRVESLFPYLGELDLVLEQDRGKCQGQGLVGMHAVA